MAISRKLTFALTALAAGLAGSLFVTGSNAQRGNRPLSETARAACRAKGGTPMRAGMAGHERCVTRYRDAGKACTGKRQCLGECRYPDGKPLPRDAGARVVGQCQATNNPFGCFYRVEGGRIAGGLCVD